MRRPTRSKAILFGILLLLVGVGAFLISWPRRDTAAMSSIRRQGRFTETASTVQIIEKVSSNSEWIEYECAPLNGGPYVQIRVEDSGWALINDWDKKNNDTSCVVWVRAAWSVLKRDSISFRRTMATSPEAARVRFLKEMGYSLRDIESGQVPTTAVKNVLKHFQIAATIPQTFVDYGNNNGDLYDATSLTPLWIGVERAKEIINYAKSIRLDEAPVRYRVEPGYISEDKLRASWTVAWQWGGRRGQTGYTGDDSGPAREIEVKMKRLPWELEKTYDVSISGHGSIHGRTIDQLRELVRNPSSPTNFRLLAYHYLKDNDPSLLSNELMSQLRGDPIMREAALEK